MKRDIKFNAMYSYFYDYDNGETEEQVELKLVIENVSIYNNKELGCSLENFENCVKKQVQEQEMIENIMESVKEFYECETEGWLYFDGVPLQYIGIKDKTGKKIFEGMTIFWENFSMFDTSKRKLSISFKECTFGIEIHGSFRPFYDLFRRKNELGWCLDIEIIGYELNVNTTEK